MNLSSKIIAMLMASIMAFACAADDDDFLADKALMNGLVKVAYDKSNDKVYLGLTTSQLSQPFLFQSSMPYGVGSNDIGLDRGQLGMTRMVSFERFGNKILLKQHNTEFRAQTDNKQERASIDQAFADSVIAGFEVDQELDGVVYFDYTDYLLSDIHGVGARLSRTGQGGYSADSSRSGVYLPRVKSFPNNTELEALVTFAGTAKGQYIKDVTPDANSVSVHLHHSFISLPDDNYQTRQFHPFSGFWKHSFMDYSVPIQDNMEQAYIPRHRLSKKDPMAATSEAIEPIVYYLDPGIPEPVMGALKEGALWWNQAFESAGYENAFQVKVLPADADPMDVRYNVIQWVHRATRGWSYGSSVIDPRTGEIIKGHVTLGSLRVRQDYLIALGMTSPLTSEDADTSAQLEMALNRIKQLSAHEVGHTLGIAHNFAASEQERASVMDYPHPLFTLENGKVSLEQAYDEGIGAWDKYVVAYGYQDFESDEQANLQSLVQMALAQGMKYKSDPDARIPRRASAEGHLWDNGADPIIEFARVSELRMHALDKFGMNSLPFGEALSSLEERLVPIYYSHRYQLDALAKQISGINYTYAVKTQADTDELVTVVEGKRQLKAIELMVSALSDEYLSIGQHIVSLIPPKAYGSSRNRESMESRMGIAFDPLSAAESVAGYTSTILLEPVRLNRLAYQNSMDKEIPSVSKLLAILFDNTLKSGGTSAVSQRVNEVVRTVFFDILSDDTLAPEVKLSMEAALVEYEKWLKKRAKATVNQVLLKYVDQYWRTGKWAGQFSVKPMPPGSPI